MDLDLFKNVNSEAFLAGICFGMWGLTSSKITVLSVVLSAEASGVRSTGPARASRAAAGARSALMRKLCLLICWLEFPSSTAHRDRGAEIAIDLAHGPFFGLDPIKRRQLEVFCCGTPCVNSWPL